MKAFLDTSVLVPVFYGDHTHHAASIELFTQCSAQDDCCGAHSLAEIYATLTRMPGRYRISTDQTMLFIDDVRERLTIIALDGDEYINMLWKSAAGGVVGGAIYDAILASCALKSGAEMIYTWNVRHFSRFGPEVTRRVRTP